MDIKLAFRSFISDKGIISSKGGILLLPDEQVKNGVQYMVEAELTMTIKIFLLLVLLAILYNAAFAVDMDGKKIAFDRNKGNCLACHAMDDGDMPGNIGPPLNAMKARFPDRAVLKAQIWDATTKNSISIMPPFGKHDILSDAEIEKLIDYLYTL